MAEVTEKDLEDVFGIPSDPVKKDSDENSTSFEEGVEEINDTLKDMDEIVPVSKKEPEIVEEKDEPKKDESKESTIDFEKETKQVQKEAESMNAPEKNDPVPIEDNVDSGDLPSGEISWLTVPPNARFNNFYKQKVSIIKEILKDKQIPFEKYENELRNSYCGVRSSIYDLPQLYNNMSEVHKIRDRVCQIRTEINSQYFKFERITELLRGLLARTLYERGKQEGVQFEHMRDVELYLESLRSLYKIADIIHKNLDAASELLSRQVTIATTARPPNRNIETSPSHPNETYIHKEVPEELTGYDTLPVGSGSTEKSNVKRKPVQGVKSTTWDEVA